MLWDRLTQQERSLLSRHSEEIDLAAGDAIVLQGETPNGFFVVREGTARVIRDGVEVAQLEAGSFFGELALLETGRRTASVVAATDMRVLVVSRTDFARLLAALPRVAGHVRAVAWRRLIGLG